MDTKSQRPEEREDALSALNEAIGAMNLPNGISKIAPLELEDIFNSVGVTLTMLRVGSY